MNAIANNAFGQSANIRGAQTKSGGVKRERRPRSEFPPALEAAGLVSVINATDNGKD